MKKYALLAFVVLLVTLANAQQVLPVTDSTVSSFKVLSWNIYMLPGWIKKSGQMDRAKLIAEKLTDSEYDVLVFQEAFTKKTREVLWNILKEAYPYNVGPVNANGSKLKLNGGVWILSKHPMDLLGEIKFNKGKGADAFSRKGAMLVEVEKNGVHYQIMGTHLQADESASRDKIRMLQCQQIHDELLVVHAKDSVPQLLCGDFNISKNDKIHYTEMLNILQAQNDSVSFGDKALHSYNWENNDLIESEYEVTTLDYIMLKKRFKPFATIKRSVVVLTEKWADRKGRSKKNLSDHHAVEITLTPAP